MPTQKAAEARSEQHPAGREAPALRPAHPRTEPAKELVDRCGSCPPPEAAGSTGLSTAFPLHVTGYSGD